MRALDLALAGVIGVASLAALAAWSPQAADDSSVRAAVRGALYDSAAQAIAESGFQRLASAQTSALCAYVSSQSNQTIGISARVGPDQCEPAPPPGVDVARILFDCGNRSVTMEAWWKGRG